MEYFDKWLNSFDSSLYTLTNQIQISDKNSVIIINRPRQSPVKIYSLLMNREYAFIVTNDASLQKMKNVILVSDDDYQQAKSRLVTKFYPISRHIKFIGITGTNGKTSTTHFIREMLVQLHLKAASVGTLGYYIKSQKIQDHAQTTPDLLDLQKFLYSNSNNIDYFIMEVSSHALEQDRLGDIKFSAAAWTNFTQDHLDYHKTMDQYFAAKALICKKILPTSKLVVLDNHPEIWSKLPEAKVHKLNLGRLALPQKFNSNFNQENIQIAFSVIEQLGVTSGDKINLERLPIIPGRYNLETVGDKIVIIDFAHTPDALENVLFQISQDHKDKSILTLFGCGGDRDKGKRSIMGKVAAKYSNEVILTSDNPRSEDPISIMQDIQDGMDGFKSVHLIENRKDAIHFALSEKTKSTVIVLAGKGHETTIDYAGVYLAHSDHDVVQNFKKSKK